MSKRVYINPGHSDRDPGAVGYEIERQLNVKVSKYMRDHLLAHYDVEVKMNPGTMSSLAAIAADANTWGADLFVSNHFNAGGGDGWEGLVYSKENTPLGRIFEKHVKAAGQNSRGVKLRPDLAVLRLTTMAAILTEGAFVDNPKDIRDWNDAAELKKLGTAYAEAAAEALGLRKKAVLVSNLYRVQVGAFTKKAAAERKRQAVQAAGFDAFITCVDGKLWRVQVGAYAERSNAEKMLAKLQKAGFSGYVTRLDGSRQA